MKKLAREKFLNLTQIFPVRLTEDRITDYLDLCSLCKYAEYSGSCSNIAIECKHPLWKISDNPDSYGYGGGDCWGFANLYSWDDCVRVIETYLLGQYPDFNKLEQKRKDG